MLVMVSARGHNFRLTIQTSEKQWPDVVEAFKHHPKALQVEAWEADDTAENVLANWYYRQQWENDV